MTGPENGLWKLPGFGDILLALGCAAGFYLVLDMGLDPLLDRLFPQSGQSYAEAASSLKARPWAGLIRVCLLAPVIEEFLMRGLLLEKLRDPLGWLPALLISSAVFALLHFNLVQTLSALICGLALGALYLHSGSLLCCILAHSLYNFFSYMAIMRA